MNFITFPLELKQTDEQGRFRGLAAVYRVPDRQGEAIVPGAFSESLQRDGPMRPLLWSHRSDTPVGLARLTDSSDGLVVDGELAIDTTSGKDAYSWIKRGIVKGLSIGFLTLKDDFRDGVRQLLSIDLLEVSLTPTPAQPLATVASVKAITTPTTENDFKRILHEQIGFSRRQAAAIATKGWAGLNDNGTDDEGVLADWLKQAAASMRP